MKLKKVNQESLKSSRGKKSAVTKKEKHKRDLSKTTIEEFLEQSFEDTDTDSDNERDDDGKNKNIGMIHKIFGFLSQFKLCVLIMLLYR